MRLFVDTANVEEIREAASWGVVSGVTTNPSLISREGRDLDQVLKEIAAVVPGPLSAEVTSLEAKAMISEARDLARIAPNVVIKVPMCEEGLKAASALASEAIPINITLVFSPNQALLAAQVGAAYVSPFVGRLDDIGHDGMDVVRDTALIFASHNLATQIIAASIRHPMHVLEAARAGAHIATVPFKVLRQMIHHPLTEAGIEKFLADWKTLKRKA
ncbi:MAG: fructose-6-phosphate aldolase [Bacillota bacterium]